MSNCTCHHIECLVGHILSSACRSLQLESPRKERIVSLLPKTLDEIQSLFAVAGAISRQFDEVVNPLSFALAKTTVKSRETAWIINNGVCLDSIFTSESSLPLAGNGAKSKYLIHQGDIIAPMPLLHISDQSLLTTYQAHVNGQTIAHDLNEKVGAQLLLNYCFSHKNSTMLLCATTNAIFANNCGNDDIQCYPNAKFQWSNNTMNKMWLKKSIDDIIEVRKTFSPLFIV